jgi:hypothetical protein
MTQLSFRDALEYMLINEMGRAQLWCEVYIPILVGFFS